MTTYYVDCPHCGDDLEFRVEDNGKGVPPLEATMCSTCNMISTYEHALLAGARQLIDFLNGTTTTTTKE